MSEKINVYCEHCKLRIGKMSFSNIGADCLEICRTCYDLLNNSEWIDIDEKQPKRNQRVLVYIPFPQERYVVATFIGRVREIRTEFNENVTAIMSHWMPLPLAPGVERE